TTGSPCCGQSAASPDGTWPKRWGSTTRRSDIWSVGSTPPASTSPSRSPSTSTCPSRWCSRCGPSPAWEARPSRADLLVELVDEGVDEPPVVVEAVVPLRRQPQETPPAPGVDRHFDGVVVPQPHGQLVQQDPLFGLAGQHHRGHRPDPRFPGSGIEPEGFGDDAAPLDDERPVGGAHSVP